MKSMIQKVANRSRVRSRLLFEHPRCYCVRWRSDYYKLSKKKPKEDPFRVLGVTQEHRYTDVKKKFLKIAMSSHPDTSNAETEEERERQRETFVQARRAFELITEGPDGLAILNEDADRVWEEQELDEWFRRQTGHEIPYMDPKTMKEVAEMTERMGQDSAGLDRDGGMWTLARMVTESVKAGGDGRAVLSLDAGDVRDRKIDGVLRRKRKF